MLEFLTGSKEPAKSSPDAIALLKQDHDKVKALFEQFENTDNLREKKRIAAEAIMELKIHAEIEEKIFYPSVREELEDDLMNEADEEHHVAKLLIAELGQMDGSEDHWEAKFTVLAENIRHHIKEEEGEMFPKARKLNMDFDALGQKLNLLKNKLKKDGVPPSDEDKLMARTKAKADSPAHAAKAKPSLKVKSASKKKPAVKAKTAKKAPARKTAAKTKSTASRSAKKSSSAMTKSRRRA